MNILFLALLLLLVVAAIRWFLGRAPKRGKRLLLQLLLITLALLGFWLAISGRLHWLFALFSILLPFAQRLLPLALRLLPFLMPLLRRHKQKRQQQGSGQHSAGQQSQVTTRWLVMSLDHDSGAIEGRVIAGPFNGRNLETLSDAELVQLYQQSIQQDPEGIKLLDAYIVRHRPNLQIDADDQSQQQQSNGAASATISRAEAYEILGLTPGASHAEIIQAHKRMMQKNHPDRGGSNYLAAKINQAKERLLD